MPSRLSSLPVVTLKGSPLASWNTPEMRKPIQGSGASPDRTKRWRRSPSDRPFSWLRSPETGGNEMPPLSGSNPRSSDLDQV